MKMGSDSGTVDVASIKGKTYDREKNGFFLATICVDSCDD